jgi:hypothetical protein
MSLVKSLFGEEAEKYCPKKSELNALKWLVHEKRQNAMTTSKYLII